MTSGTMDRTQMGQAADSQRGQDFKARLAASGFANRPQGTGNPWKPGDAIPAGATQLAKADGTWNTAGLENMMAGGATPPAAPAPAPAADPYMPAQPSAAAMAGAPIAAQTAAPAAVKPKAKGKTTAKTATTPAAPTGGKQYNLVMPPNLYGASAAYAQNVIDNYKKFGNNDPVAYQNAREQLAHAMAVGTARRYNDSMGPGRR